MQECRTSSATTTSAAVGSTASRRGEIAWTRWRRTTSVLRALDEALVAAHLISVKEFDVLITLFNAPDGRLRMTELAERALLTPSGLTHLVTRLERDGLVRRSVDAADRRSFFATLTRAGHRRLRESRPTHNEVIRAHLTRRLTASQLATLGALWEAVQTGEM